ncbi:MAG: polysaccharide biosynthesis protein [Actinobacteria bacterium]|nr:polysaccharide biosynthesis protein [Actinomycetota bacterium]MBV8394867.1 polysaccharide biosynthesis protein [Actinomycetota bacterium]
MISFPVNRHRIWQLLADALLIAAAWRLTFFLRFDQTIPPYYRHLLSWRVFVAVVAIKLSVFVLFGFYNRWWRYVSTRDMWGAARGVVAASLLTDLVLYAFPPSDTSRLPRLIAVLDLLLLLAFVAGSRLLARSLIERPQTGLVARGKEVLIVGAGDAAQLLIREMQRNRHLAYTPIGLVDDDPHKKNMRLHGIRVLGTTDDLTHILRDNKPDEVLIAMPSAPGEVRRKIVEATRAEGVTVKTLPGLGELISGDLNLAGQIRPVQVEDVLGREQVEVDLGATAAYIRNRTVLVTGAGGSIGSELCRQLARLGAARLVLVEQGESALYELERELVDERNFAAAIPVLADCGELPKMRQVCERYRPDVVFHAAAYKHVPMLESNPLQAVTNNVLATRVMAQVSVEFDVDRFVLISTDKAANPKNLLGQSKAVCEWIVESFALREDVETRFVAVRFGNVLGSSGSVIPIFRRQIERGGPVTVTHPEMTRYFMTIPEAASLVVQAGAMGGRGQVYVLDMGKPVKILDLARQMIELSGRTEEQVPIAFVGARAGEKLHEELWNAGEAVGPTSHPKIMRAARPPIDAGWLDDELADLERLVAEGDTLGVTAKLGTMVKEPRRAGQAVLEDTLH